ncbi:ACP S-malonyltransferase [Paralcaligenes sp. KSB-10]|uniref:ACP S-malonyltransferase n=1 Tax=Paralcaligenes sp. KSB-10 TaxID=2901142 RepID=UPI002102AE39|nr:acyltransferase domain-containing protein [Paralcaligenes sp. KSB-10]
MQRLAILCPGQGGQHPHMFDLAKTDTRVEGLLEHWLPEVVCGMPLQEILDDHELLFSNRIAQPLIVAAELAVWEAIKLSIPPPALVAGYSVGEVASYGVAGALSADETIGLAAFRARCMDAHAEASARQSLMAVSGLRSTVIHELITRHGLSIAIENGEDSLILGGLHHDLQAVEPLLAQMGGHTVAIPVAIASHTPLMLGAVAPFREKLEHCAFADFTSPVISGVLAELIATKEKAVTLLPRQIAEKIDWAGCMDACAEAGITVALELGPGGALSRMLRARHPTIESRSVSDFRTLPGVLKWLDRSLR